jgi:fructose-1,6-bisphosphatase
MEGIYAYADHIKIIKAVLDATQEIQHYLRFNSAHLLKTKNPFGKQQSDIDLKANEIVFKHMKNSGVIHAAISEETPEVSRNQLEFILQVTDLCSCRKLFSMRVGSTW